MIHFLWWVPDHLVAIRHIQATTARWPRLTTLSVKYFDDEGRGPKYQNTKDKGHPAEVRLPAGFSQTLFNSSSPIKFISNNISESLLFFLL